MAYTVEDTLKSLSAYPIPRRTLEEIAARRGIYLGYMTYDKEVTESSLNLAKADLYEWLANAPNVSQGGISYSFTEEQRFQFRMQAHRLYSESDITVIRKSVYGYKGSRL